MKYGWLLAALLPLNLPAQTLDVSRAELKSFIERMESQGFERASLEKLLAKAESKESILTAMSRPAEKTLSWQEYRARFITEQRISQGVQFWLEHRELLDKAEQRWQIPAQYILAIIGVETSYGRITGKYRVIDALSTLAFDYPPRSEYFLAELEQFLLMTREEQLDPLSLLGSYAGAMGPPQFMPRSIRKFAVDADNDGKRNLWSDWDDIISSVANYLHVHGWKGDEKVKVKLPAEGDADQKPTGSHNFGVIMTYNRSPLYAMAVHDLATELAAKVFAPASE